VACQRKGCVRWFPFAERRVASDRWSKHKKVCTPRPKPIEEPRPAQKPIRLNDDDVPTYEPEEHIVVQEEIDPIIPQHLIDPEPNEVSAE